MVNFTPSLAKSSTGEFRLIPVVASIKLVSRLRNF